MKKLYELVMKQIKGGKSVETIKEERTQAVNGLADLVNQLDNIK